MVGGLGMTFDRSTAVGITAGNVGKIGSSREGTLIEASQPGHRPSFPAADSSTETALPHFGHLKRIMATLTVFACAAQVV
jgi:hypothetical protein